MEVVNIGDRLYWFGHVRQRPETTLIRRWKVKTRETSNRKRDVKLDLELDGRSEDRYEKFRLRSPYDKSSERMEENGLCSRPHFMGLWL